MTDEVSNMANEILEEEAKHRRALAMLLGKYASKTGELLVQKTSMGGTVAFLGSVTLEWFDQKVRFANALPLFRKSLSDTGELIIDEETVDAIQQRPLDWTRQAPLAQYLATNKNHKFPPVLAVATRDWVDDPDADEWGSDGKAMKAAVGFTSLDDSGQIGLLDVSDEVEIYALDGQHRLMGVTGLMALIKTGRLNRKRKGGTEVKSAVTVEDIAELYGVQQEQIQTRGHERIGIEFISAVVAGETREEAKRRVRSIFVHVNTMAAPLSKSQTDQLDEDYGFAIIARKAAVKHPLLKDRIEWHKTNVTDGASEITTLHTLKEMAAGLLGGEYKWRPKEKSLIPQRPEDQELEEGFTKLMYFLDQLEQLHYIQQLQQGGETGSLRKFGGDGKGYLLLRPVAQMALADAIGELVDGPKKLALEKIFSKIQSFDRSGGFLHFNEPKSAWYGVLYDPLNKKVKLTGRRLAVELLKYLLGGGIPDEEERETLRDEFAKSRTLGKRAINFDGKDVEPETISLPNAL